MINKIFDDLHYPSITRFLSPINKGKYPIYYYYADENPKRNTYIIYLIYDESHDFYADNNALSDKYLIQVDVFSKNSPDELAQEIEKHLTRLDYRLITRYNNFEKDTKLYHKSLRFNLSVLKKEEEI